MMMSLLKRASRGGNRGQETGDGHSGGKIKPVKLLEAIMASRVSTKQSAGATVLNRTGIKVESDTTRVNNLTTRKELHVKLRNMCNRRNMKRESTKNASTNDYERGTIRLHWSNRNQRGIIIEKRLRYQESIRMHLDEEKVVSRC
jgi:hypothetical protein